MSALPGSTRFGYSLGSFATGAFGTVPGLLLLPYLTDTLGVAAVAAGLIVLLPKAWDIVFNPIAGRLSDDDLARTGSRRRFVLSGGLALAVLLAAVFAHPGLGSTAADAAYVVVAFFLCACAYGIFQVPYNAMTAEITESYNERTRLTSWRVGALSLAILLYGAGAPIITAGVGGTQGYRVMGLVVAAVVVLGTLSVFLGTRRIPRVGQHTPETSWRELLAAVRGWRSFRTLVGVYFVQALGLGVLLASTNYAARYIFGDPALQTAIFVGLILPALVMMPVWPRIGAKRGKLWGFRFACAVFGIGALGLAASPLLPIWAAFVFVALVGIGYAGIEVFPLAILPDLISAEEQRTASTRAGIAAGVWTGAETLGLALGPGLFGLILGAGGYVSSVDGSAAQTSGAITAILIGFSLVPGFLVVLGVPLLRRSAVPEQRELREEPNVTVDPTTSV